MIDGEHYLPVIKSALESIEQDKKHKLLAAVFLGGTEKIVDEADLSYLGVPIILDNDSIAGIRRALTEFQPDLIVDLSDEPVVGYKERFKLASVALTFGVVYEGADFRFEPPIFHNVAEKPSISIIGTGKRVGKTAVSAYMARELDKAGFSPCVVAMGRGGPKDPEVVEGQKTLTPEFLLEISRAGKHAASDHYEDALMSRITTVGCRRCGGGMAGAPFISNVLEGAKVANQLKNRMIIFEGSGAALPPVRTDTCVVTVGATQPLDYIGGYFGTYRLLLSNLVILTMCESPMADKEKVNLVDSTIRKINPALKVVHTIFRPSPLESIAGEKVFLTTTAVPYAQETLKEYLENKFDCQVVGVSHNLSNRELLRKDLSSMKGKFTAILTELKAASVDVVTNIGLDLGVRVVYTDNVPVAVGGDKNLDKLMLNLAERAEELFKERRVGKSG